MRSIGKIWLTCFWLLFAAGITFHFWIGDVVIDYKIEGSQHFVMLREQAGEWTPINTAVLWAHLIVEYSLLAFGSLIAAWALWRWLWHGSLGGSK